MLKNFIIYIGTFGDKQLAEGAAKSVLNYCSDNFDLILLNFSQNPVDSIYFTKIINLSLPKWMGIFGVKIMNETKSGIYIDDDMRLISSCSLKNRYGGGYYKPINGGMIVTWNDPNKLFQESFYPMSQWRMDKLCRLIDDEKLANLCAINQCEQIDSIWIHLDKCSEPRTEDRQKLIDYIDNYGGGVVPPSHSVNS